MYKEINLIHIDIESCQKTCMGCPTIFEFTDKEGTNYYFRLRHGEARLECETTGETLCYEGMRGKDGVCDWEDVVNWALEHNIVLKYDRGYVEEDNED